MRRVILWLLVDCAALTTLGLVDHRPPRRVAGLVLSRHSEHVGNHLWSGIPCYRSWVVVRTADGSLFCVPMSTERLGSVAVFDIVEGEAE